MNPLDSIEIVVWADYVQINGLVKVVLAWRDIPCTMDLELWEAAHAPN